MGKNKRHRNESSIKKRHYDTKIDENTDAKRKRLNADLDLSATRSSRQRSPSTTPKSKQRKTKGDCRKIILDSNKNKGKINDKNNNATIGITKNSTRSGSKTKLIDNDLDTSHNVIESDIIVSVKGGRLNSDDDVELDYVDDVTDGDRPVSDSDGEDEQSSSDEDSEGESSDDDEETDNEVILNKTPKKVAPQELNEDDPRVKQLLAKMVGEKIKKGELKEPKKTNKKGKDKADKNDKGKSNRNSTCLINPPLIKSPSDTTIYAPALNRGANDVLSIFNDQQSSEAINGIVQFIEGIRIQQKKEEKRKSDIQEPVASTSDHHDEISEEMNREKSIQEARDKAAKAIIDAEMYKAIVDDPRGMISNGNNPKNLPEYRIGSFEQNESRDDYGGESSQSSDNGAFAQWPQFLEKNDCEVNDDAFFHITCHIEPKLRSAIEKGEFVELDKLLPRNRFKKRTQFDGKFRWVTRGSDTFLSPIENEGNGITSIRKWEQAFRVYATIFSKANPIRAAEIWQYIHVINVAASSYQWDNVAEYDFAFRQLMHANPRRSWAKTYNQIWNLTLRDPIVRTNYSGHTSGSYGNHNGGYNNHNGGNSQTAGPKKADTCWKFNRSGHCSEGRNCKWPHKCKYCRGTSHGYNSCRKRLAKQSTPQTSDSSSKLSKENSDKQDN